MGARRAAAVTAARASALASRVLGRGGGTALPGLVATALDRDIIRDLTTQLACGAIAVSGTNGKTTTSRLLSGILEAAGYNPLRNQSGSNLERGLASSLVQKANLLGRLAHSDRAVGVFEIDEAALPQVLDSVRPGTLVLLDLFRDQLDRYGEVATVASAWIHAMQRLPTTTTVVANADDPLVSLVAASATGQTLYFGIESADRISGMLEHASDVKTCPRCGNPIGYSAIFLGHVGHYRCANCGFERPEPQVYARNVKLRGLTGSEFDLRLSGVDVHITFPLPGMYNVYNAIGAAAAAQATGVQSAEIKAGLEGATAAFGRMERIPVDGRTVVLALAKNPAGLNEVLRTLLESDSGTSLLMMLNDNTADGRDVSWIWDADVEMLRGHVASAVFSGTRAEDMALRFKYAGVTDELREAGWEIQRNTEDALKAGLQRTPAGGTLFVVPTYTAMLDFRQVLAQMGYVRPYWEE